MVSTQPNFMLAPDGNDPSNPVRIYTDGIFDCFHYGHARVLKQCKEMFKHVYLIVGVCSDEETQNEKGITIMSEAERAECVRHCKWVDEVYENGPWLPTMEFLDGLKCHYIAHDPIPYPMGDIPDVYGEFKVHKRFLSTHRTEGISTTDIMNRVIKHYDLYLLRNIRRGATAEDLNISPSKYFILKISIIFDKINDKRNLIKNLNRHLICYFQRWRESK